MLKSAGYDVTTVSSAGRALELCEKGEDFDVIISDIEMPEMDGFAFAEAVRGETSAGAASRSSPCRCLIRAGISTAAAGRVSHYVAKLDPIVAAERVVDPPPTSRQPHEREAGGNVARIRRPRRRRPP